MMGVARKWVCAGLAGLGLLATAATVQAQAEPAPVVLTDADRVSRNFTREAATVAEGDVRVEVRALRVEERAAGGTPDCRGPLRSNCARLNLIGQRVLGVERLNGGIFELITSYGVAENAEIGLVIPGYIEHIDRDDGTGSNVEDLGDLTAYGKFKYPVAENCSVGGGLELFFPPWNGLDSRQTTITSGTGAGKAGSVSGFSTGELGVNPFVSTRYQQGRFGVGAHLGYTFYTSDDVEEVFNYSAHVLARVTPAVALRTELSGRLWDQFSEQWSDVVIMPGIDVNMTESVVLRPTGMAGVTGTAIDWGIGMGAAMTF